jgi:hypothetical protein
MSITYNRSHNHTNEAGFDIVHTSWATDAHGTMRTTIDIVEYVEGATNYLTALNKAKAYRAQQDHYGIPTARYSCGCRSVANNIGILSDFVTVIDRTEPVTV